MPMTPIRASDTPIPAKFCAKPLRAASRLPRSAAEPDPHVDAMHVGQRRLTRIGMPPQVPLAPGHLTAEGNDLRLAVELFPPLLIPPALHPFFGFQCRHEVSGLCAP